MNLTEDSIIQLEDFGGGSNAAISSSDDSVSSTISLNQRPLNTTPTGTSNINNISDWGIDDIYTTIRPENNRMGKLNISKNNCNEGIDQLLSSPNDLYSPVITPSTAATEHHLDLYNNEEDSNWKLDDFDGSNKTFSFINDIDDEQSTVVHYFQDNSMINPIDNRNNNGSRYCHRQSEFSAYAYLLLDEFLMNTFIQTNHIRSSLDKFKFQIIASSFMSDKSYNQHRRASVTKVCPINSKPNVKNNKIVIDLRTIPSHRLVHSADCFFLSYLILFFTKKHIGTLSLGHAKLLIILSLTLFNLHSRTKEIANKVYLKILNNRLREFLHINELFDETLNTHLKLVRNSTNNHLNHLFGGNSANIKQKIKTSDLQVKSVLNTLILSLNSKLQHIIRLVDPCHLEKYLDIYQLGLVNDNLKFINILNHDELLEDLKPAALPSRLKPLRLRSFSGESHLTRSSSVSAASHQQHLQQLTTNPFKLFQNFETIRKVLMCVLLSIVEENSHQPSKESRIFLNLCARKFNLFSTSLKFISIPTKLLIIIQLLTKSSRLFNSLTSELDDSELSIDMGYLQDDMIPPIAEDNEDETYKKLILTVDRLAIKLSLMELNSNNIDRMESLTKIGDSVKDLVLQFNDSIESLNKSQENSRRSDDFTLSSISLPSPRLKDNEKFDPVISRTKKRHSSGLSFNLVRVFEDKSEQDGDLSDAMNGSYRPDDSKILVHTEDGVKEIEDGSAEGDDVKSKEELKLTLEKLCASRSTSAAKKLSPLLDSVGNVMITDKSDEGSITPSDERLGNDGNVSGSVNMSTPIKTEQLTVLKRELKGILMNAL